MGYTHYWERPSVLPRPQFVAAVDDCRRLCAAMDIPLGDAQGKATPAFSVEEICFNGHVDSSRLTSGHGRVLGPITNGSYEAFRVERVCRPRHSQQPPQGWSMAFCKTHHLPYDLCVQACLIVLSHHLGLEQFRVTSDGTSRNWNDARNAAQQILGYGIDWGEGKLAPLPPSPPVE